MRVACVLAMYELPGFRSVLPLSYSAWVLPMCPSLISLTWAISVGSPIWVFPLGPLPGSTPWLPPPKFHALCSLHWVPLPGFLPLSVHPLSSLSWVPPPGDSAPGPPLGAPPFGPPPCVPLSSLR